MFMDIKKHNRCRKNSYVTENTALSLSDLSDVGDKHNFRNLPHRTTRSTDYINSVCEINNNSSYVSMLDKEICLPKPNITRKTINKPRRKKYFCTKFMYESNSLKETNIQFNMCEQVSQSGQKIIKSHQYYMQRREKQIAGTKKPYLIINKKCKSEPLHVQLKTYHDKILQQ